LVCFVDLAQQNKQDKPRKPNKRSTDMHIAVVPHIDASLGGAYQYTLAMLDSLANISQSRQEDRYTLIVRSERERRNFDQFTSRWELAKFPFFTRERFMDAIKTSAGQGWLRQAIKQTAYRLAPANGNNPDRIRSNRAGHRFMKRCAVDWVLYTTPNEQSFEMGIPYVMPIFDLQHRLQPEFPEVSADGEWDRREYLYRNGTREAMLILADSEVGKEDVLNCYGSYGITPDRVKVLPYLSPPYLASEVAPSERQKVRATYRLPERYLLYPAQFWPHKNHLRIIQALGLLKETKQADAHVVFCGTYGGTIRTNVYRTMMKEVERLKVTDLVHCLGYVPNDAMSALYAEAVGLVMPTFFGPTNIPIMESWLCNCPVLTSDIRGIREQVGEAGLLVDPRSVEAIANGMSRLWNDQTLRTDLIQRGLNRLRQYTKKDFSTKLADIVATANRRAADLNLKRAA
jgi:glycosyltransferase involved in cell wall biosynthesis